MGSKQRRHVDRQHRIAREGDVASETAPDSQQAWHRGMLGKASSEGHVARSWLAVAINKTGEVLEAKYFHLNSAKWRKCMHQKKALNK